MNARCKAHVRMVSDVHFFSLYITTFTVFPPNATLFKLECCPSLSVLAIFVVLSLALSLSMMGLVSGTVTIQ